MNDIQELANIAGMTAKAIESGKLVWVVRCKNCIFGKPEEDNKTNKKWVYCYHYKENRPEEWFCADGKRK